jgi:exopolysaccharide biosynthesis protein
LLSVGNNGNLVKELQIKLTQLGFPCGIIDGDFGTKTLNAIKQFQIKYDIPDSGIADEETLFLIDESFYNINNLTGYRKIRDYNSDIHIYETSSNEFVDVTLGKINQLEKLSTITEDDKNIVTKINCGFFNFDGSAEHLGLFVDEGKYYLSENNTFIDFIYYKDGHTEIKTLPTLSEVSYVQGNAYWAIGTSWSLIINGHINMINAEKINHSLQRHPRTLIGQKRNGNFVLVVVQGRNSNNTGITAQESAELMMKLGCINAVNLDGGASSEMIVNNQIMNNPTDGLERKIGSAIIVCLKPEIKDKKILSMEFLKDKGFITEDYNPTDNITFEMFGKMMRNYMSKG